jgi:hypothetical protein
MLIQDLQDLPEAIPQQLKVMGLYQLLLMLN